LTTFKLVKRKNKTDGILLQVYHKNSLMFGFLSLTFVIRPFYSFSSISSTLMKDVWTVLVNSAEGHVNCGVLCRVYTCKFDNQITNEKLVSKYYCVVKVT